MLPNKRGKNPLLRKATKGPHVLQALHAKARIHENEKLDDRRGRQKPPHVRRGPKQAKTRRVKRREHQPIRLDQQKESTLQRKEVVIIIDAARILISHKSNVKLIN